MPMGTENCVGNYEYIPGGVGKAQRTATYPSNVETHCREEGSHLKEYIFKITGGTGKYAGAKGGGTYFYKSLTNTLSGGAYEGRIELL
jgi:hypothetical protein